MPKPNNKSRKRQTPRFTGEITQPLMPAVIGLFQATAPRARAALALALLADWHRRGRSITGLETVPERPLLEIADNFPKTVQAPPLVALENGRKFRATLADLRERFETVLVDAGTGAAIARESEILLLPISSDTADIPALQALHQRLMPGARARRLPLIVSVICSIGTPARSHASLRDRLQETGIICLRNVFHLADETPDTLAEVASAPLLANHDADDDAEPATSPSLNAAMIAHEIEGAWNGLIYSQQIRGQQTEN